MILMEFDFRVYDPSYKPFFLPTGVMEPPWLPRWMSFCNMAVRQRGGTPDAANMLYSWTLRHPAFEDVVYDEYFVPTAPFMSHEVPDYQFIRTIAKTMRDDISVSDWRYVHLNTNSQFAFYAQAFLRSCRPLLLESGLAESFVDELQHRAHVELSESRTATYVRLERVYARKKS
jgi:hypothetical protein